MIFKVKRRNILVSKTNVRHAKTLRGNIECEDVVSKIYNCIFIHVIISLFLCVSYRRQSIKPDTIGSMVDVVIQNRIA